MAVDVGGVWVWLGLDDIIRVDDNDDDDDDDDDGDDNNNNNADAHSEYDDDR